MCAFKCKQSFGYLDIKQKTQTRKIWAFRSPKAIFSSVNTMLHACMMCLFDFQFFIFKLRSHAIKHTSIITRKILFCKQLDMQRERGKKAKNIRKAHYLWFMIFMCENFRFEVLCSPDYCFLDGFQLFSASKLKANIEIENLNPQLCRFIKNIFIFPFQRQNFEEKAHQ